MTSIQADERTQSFRVLLGSEYTQPNLCRLFLYYDSTNIPKGPLWTENEQVRKQILSWLCKEVSLDIRSSLLCCLSGTLSEQPAYAWVHAAFLRLLVTAACSIITEVHRSPCDPLWTVLILLHQPQGHPAGVLSRGLNLITFFLLGDFWP